MFENREEILGPTYQRNHVHYNTGLRQTKCTNTKLLPVLFIGDGKALLRIRPLKKKHLPL